MLFFLAGCAEPYNERIASPLWRDSAIRRRRSWNNCDEYRQTGIDSLAVAGNCLVGAVASFAAEPSGGAGRGPRGSREQAPDNEGVAAAATKSTDKVWLANEQAKLAREFAELEQSLSQLVEYLRSNDPQEVALLREAWIESRRVLLRDRCAGIISLLSTGRLYAAASEQRAVLKDQKKLLELLEDNDWTKGAEVERQWLPRFIAGIHAVKWFRHSVVRPENGPRLANLWLRRQNNNDKKVRVLLLAGGPTREYQFVRDQLSRDPGMIIDALLQTADVGTTQDVHQLLERFPGTDEKLAKYDAIVAFDPDWGSLDAEAVARARPSELLDRWVAFEGGRLILIAGPVYTEEMSYDRRMTLIRSLYPVEFVPATNQQSREQTFGNEDACAVRFTREGLDADFPRLNASPAASRRAWDIFSGIYDCFPAYRTKAAAVVYARLADPDIAPDAKMPIFMAGQSYGWGQVFYLGSGELWRLRSLNEAYFNRLYVQLLRFDLQDRASVERRFYAVLAHDLIELFEAAQRFDLPVEHPLADRLVRLLDSPAVDAQVLRAASRIAELKRFHTVVERLTSLTAAQERLNLETRKVQRKSLNLTDE